MSLSNFSNFDQISYQFKQTRQKSKQIQDNLQNYITTNTINEKKQLELALENYEKKIKQLMENKKSSVDTLENYQKEMSNTLMQTYEAFNKTVESIQNNHSLNDKQKEQKINEAAEFIMNSLFTQEEVDEFKNHAQNMVIVVSNDDEHFNRLTTPQLTNGQGLNSRDNNSADITFF